MKDRVDAGADAVHLTWSGRPEWPSVAYFEAEKEVRGGSP